MTDFLQRIAKTRIEEALDDSPVVLVKGPRQSGKTTLVRMFEREGRDYITLDDETVLSAASSDPVGFLRGLDTVIIDEIQRAPELLRAIKKAVDEDRRAGRFLLTGSADLMTLPIVSESLAGRMETVSLYPFAAAEMMGTEPNFIASLFEGKLPRIPETIVGDALVDLVLAGGYPEMQRRSTLRRRTAWVRDYVDAMIQRDVRDISEIERFDELRHLLRILPHYVGQLINLADLGRNTGLDAKTVRRYLGLLEQLFLVRRIEAWHRNDLKRLVKSPKLAFIDTGLLATLRGMDAAGVRADRTAFGGMLESYVFGEILKQIAWTSDDIRIAHFRDKDGMGVDLVLENANRQCIGLEVKASATVRTDDFRGLRKLSEVAGAGFSAGYVLYDGDTVVPFGDGLFAVPLSILWSP